MEKWRKKPVVIDAEVLTERTVIRTLEGEMVGEVGDYLITGVKGEKYPCKPDIFHQTYEPVDDKRKKPRHEDVMEATAWAEETVAACRKIIDKDRDKAGWIRDADMLIDKFDKATAAHLKVFDGVDLPEDSKVVERMGDDLNREMRALKAARDNMRMCMGNFQHAAKLVVEVLQPGAASG